MTASAEISLSISIYLYLSIYLSIYLSLSEIDKIRLLGFTTLHDSRRYAIPLCWIPHTPRHKGTVCGDDEYAPIDLGISIYLSIYLGTQIRFILS